nr:RecName: Full=Uncharacterized protein SPCC417.03 [Schizosaccharomyces pombe 972h-]
MLPHTAFSNHIHYHFINEAPFRLCIYTLFHAHTCFSCGLSLSLMEV